MRCLSTERYSVMSSSIISAILFTLCFLLSTFVANSSPNVQRIKEHHPAAHIHRDLNKKSIDCLVHELGGIVVKPNFDEDQIQQRFTCGSENHGPTVLLLGNYNSFLEKQTFTSGVTSLTIPTELVSEKMEVDLDDPSASEIITTSNKNDIKRGLRLEPTPQRSLISDYHGFFKTLVVRVSDSRGHSPTFSAAEISKHVFFGDLTMASQFRACSNDQLNFTPALGGSDIVDGVVDVHVDIDLSTTYYSLACVNAADDALDSKYDIGTTYTYVMYICPDVVDFGNAAGVGEINGKKSWYKDTFGSFPYIQMHEIGHNLAFFHSGDGIGEYGDASCIMGGHYESDLEWGRMCFNAAKTWHTGWYSNQHVTVTPTNDLYYGNLVDVNSIFLGYDRSENDVVVKVNDENETDLYFMLHRLEGITRDMKDKFRETFANRINIIRRRTGMPSSLVGHLASGEEYVQVNWGDTGQSLHIKVCSIADHYEDGGAKVLVFLDSMNPPSCSDEVLAPTTTPSVSPTVTPSSGLGTCHDSNLKTKINGFKRSCTWVGANNTRHRCQKPGMASHCPLTCLEVEMCNADSKKRFQLKDSVQFQSCDWVGRKLTKQRCQKEGVASTCRATCAAIS